MTSPLMTDYVATRLESNINEFRELESREKTLSSIMRDQVTSILNREDMKHFDESHKSWRKNPQFGLSLLVASHFGVKFIFNTWYGFLEDLEFNPGGPSLERMLDVIMIEGHDPRFQYINVNAKWLMTRFICTQKDREAVVDSWIKYSRSIADNNSMLRRQYYLHVPLAEEKALADLKILAKSQAEKWERMNQLYFNRFKLLSEQVTAASEHFTIGHSSVASLHRQIRQQLSKVQAESTRLEMSRIRIHTQEDESTYTPTDFLDFTSPLARLTPSPTIAQPETVQSEAPQPDLAPAEAGAALPQEPAAATNPAPKANSTPPTATAATPATIAEEAERAIKIEQRPIETVFTPVPGPTPKELTPAAFSQSPVQQAEKPLSVENSKDPRGPVPELIEEMKKYSNARWERKQRRELEKLEREYQESIKKAASVFGVFNTVDSRLEAGDKATSAQRVSIGKEPPHASNENVRRVEKGHVGPPGHHAAGSGAASEAKTQASAAKGESGDSGKTSGVNRQIVDPTRPPPPGK